MGASDLSAQHRAIELTSHWGWIQGCKWGFPVSLETRSSMGRMLNLQVPCGYKSLRLVQTLIGAYAQTTPFHLL